MQIAQMMPIALGTGGEAVGVCPKAGWGAAPSRRAEACRAEYSKELVLSNSAVFRHTRTRGADKVREKQHLRVRVLVARAECKLVAANLQPARLKPLVLP
jgi:hypothetical protein